MNTRVPTSSVPGNRRYSSPQREAAARHTRERVVEAASALFGTHGYDVPVRTIAEAAGVSTATVELLFGTKAALLARAIDVALAGDHEPVAVLDRAWVRDLAKQPPADFLRGAGSAFGTTAARVAPLLHALDEGARRTPELAALADRRRGQRLVMARWVVGVLARRGVLAADLTRARAVETTAVLLDPGLHRRLLVEEHWPADRLGRWLGRCLDRLLLDPDDIP